MKSKIVTVSREQAQETAIMILGWLAGQEELFLRFLAVSGLSVSTIRAASAEPGFLPGVLDFMMAHEPTLMDFSSQSGLGADFIASCHRALAGGVPDSWT